MERLKKRRDFQATAKGSRTGRAAFVLQMRDRSDDLPPRLGLTVTKKTAPKAVERNRIRRRLRAAADMAEGEAKPGRDYVLIGRRGVLDMDFAGLVGDIATAFGEADDPSKRRTRRGSDRKCGSRTAQRSPSGQSMSRP